MGGREGGRVFLKYSVVEKLLFFKQLAFQETIFLKAPCFVKFSRKYFNLLYLIKLILTQRLAAFWELHGLECPALPSLFIMVNIPELASHERL